MTETNTTRITNFFADIYKILTTKFQQFSLVKYISGTQEGGISAPQKLFNNVARLNFKNIF